MNKFIMATVPLLRWVVFLALVGLVTYVAFFRPEPVQPAVVKTTPPNTTTATSFVAADGSTIQMNTWETPNRVYCTALSRPKNSVLALSCVPIN